ncbi:MAG: hypothetical protein HFI54_11715 [Lachnospiraceae bacterium]|nr:hypothetical protein [Lachnospiraceae bacterium]
MASKNLVSGAGDLAMNAALSNYHEELNEVYGLLAMANTPQEIESIMKDCFETSLNASGVSREDFSKALVYLELTEGGFSASSLVDTEIYQTEVFKQEVLEYMKYRAPVTLVDRAVKDKVGKLETISEERAAADAELKFEKELNDVQQLLDELNELADKQKQYVGQIGTKESLNRLLSETESNYGKITLLSVAHYRLSHCTDSASGDMKSLMRKMVDLSCGVSEITADVASHLIRMKRIENAMQGKDPDDLLDGLDEDSDEYQEIEELIENYEDAKSVMEEGIKNTEKQLDELVEKSYNAMHEQWQCAKEGSENCTGILNKISEIRSKLEDCKGKYENWKDAVSHLSNEQSKTAYQKSIDEVSGLFEKETEGNIEGYEKKIQNNQIYFDEVVVSLDQVIFMGYRIDYDVSSKAVFIGEADYGQIISAGEVRSAADDFMVGYSSPSTMSLSVEIDRTIDERDPFIEKLKNTYCNTDGADKGKADEETKKWKDKLTEKKEELDRLLTCEDIPDENVDSIAGGRLPTAWLGIRTVPGTEDNAIQAQGSLEDKQSRKKAAESGSDNLNQDNATLTQMSSLGSLMAGVGEDVIEPLYCTEYVMGMFSHYTTNRERDGSEISDPESLSRAKLNQDALYRAEIEYILWGDPGTRNNVKKTKAIVFAVNFVFNMSFAFTNVELGNQARTIAAFFPVGAVGKIAIKCALLSIVAMIETTDNMVDLMNGKPVLLIKDSSHWKTWLGVPGGAYQEDDKGFTYEDYLWILVCVNMYLPSKQTELLGRTADCIELNLTDKKTKEENTLRRMYTMLSVDAEVSIDTFFLQRLGGAGVDVPYDRNTFKVDYHGIQGY